MRSRLGLVTRITAVFVLFSAVVLIGVGLLSYRSGRLSLEAAATSELLSSALAKETQFDSWVETRAMDVEAQAASPALVAAAVELLGAAPSSAALEAARAAVVLELKPRTELRPATHQLFALADARTGRYVAATKPGLVGQSASDQAFFTSGKTGRHVQNPYIARELGGPGMAVGVPVKGRDGEVIAVLVGWPNLQQANDILNQRSGLHRSDEAYLVNPEHQFATRPRFKEAGAVLNEKVFTDAVNRCLQGNSGVLSSVDYRGVPAIVVYRWMPKHKLGLISKMDQEEAFGAAGEFGRSVILFTVLVLLATLVGAALLARTIIRPVRALQAGVTRFGRGDLDVRLPATGNDELAQLAVEFNNMAAAITHKEALLVANAAQLEVRVRERTQVLQQQADLLELAHDAVIVRDIDGTIRFWNRGAQGMYGWSAAEAVGKTTHALLANRGNTEREAFDAALANDGRWEGQLTHTRRDGNRLMVESRQVVQLDEGGRPIGVLEINSDVTEHKRAEDELKRFFVLSRDMLCIASFEGYFLRLNPAWEHVLGYSNAELCAEPFLNFVHPDDREATVYHSQALTQGVDTVLFENRYRCKDGSYRWLLWQAVPTEEPSLIYAAAHDITERKRFEAELQRSMERSEIANRAKSEFLANMSHEIRTPMNGVIGLTNLVLKTRLDPQQSEYLGLIKSSADSLLRLLNDILDFSKMEARKLELDPIEFDLRETLGNTLKAFAASANAKGVELTHGVAPDVSKVLLGDPGRLSQIIVNLAGNALKFTEQGEVVVRVSQRTLADGMALLQFSVTDTGIGISAEQQKHIFEAFAQADSSTTRQYGGTGLGLTIVAQLVSLMDGELSVESTPGVGTTFGFTVKLSIPSEPALSTSYLEPVLLKHLPVLVVDDNRTNRLILGEILLSWNMRPTLAGSGKEALLQLSQAASNGAPFALALLDSRMPGLDGFELAEAIRSDAALGNATVMMLSSGDLSGEIERCRQLGIARYLRKPVKQSELFDSIMTALNFEPSGGGKAKPVSAPIAAPGRLHVLVAEDHPINQRLVAEILRERGHTFAIVGNGLEVLAILEREHFDVILMDGQMPEMDGYQTTAEIRQRERVSGKHIRIIAVTAHAMKQDRDECLAAGMDDYIAKPIDADELIHRIEASALPGGAVDLPPAGPSTSIASTAVHPSCPTVPPDSSPAFDPAAALARARNKPALLKQLVGAFLSELPLSISVLEGAMKSGDAAQVERAAHRLRGAATTLTADRLARLAGEMEGFARAARMDRLSVAFSRLREEAAKVTTAMADFAEAMP